MNFVEMGGTGINLDHVLYCIFGEDLVRVFFSTPIVGKDEPYCLDFGGSEYVEKMRVAMGLAEPLPPPAKEKKVRPPITFKEERAKRIAEKKARK